MVQNLFEAVYFFIRWEGREKAGERRREGEIFHELVGHTDVKLPPRVCARQKVSQLTSFVEYFIV